MRRPCCAVCGNLIEGFRGRLIHVKDDGSVLGLDHDPVHKPAGGDVR
jgi:hypothetical protein